jgi:hypothetical protein
MSDGIEKKLKFDFGGAFFEKLDKQGTPMPIGMSFVDFVIEDSNYTYLFEIKDPSDYPPAQPNFIERMKSADLINNELVPKVRDSYCYLHLMRRDNKEMIFIVIIGIETDYFNADMFSDFKNRLLKRIRHEADIPWKKIYIKDCIVIPLYLLSKYFPQYSYSKLV